MSPLRTIIGAVLLAAVALCSNVTNSTTDNIVVPPLRWQAILFIVLLTLFVVVLSSGLLKVLPAMVLMAVVLFLTQLVTATELFVGFSNNGNLSIALLFIIVKPISQLPLVKRLVEWLMRGSDEGQRWPLFKLCLISMLLSSFLENTPHVAIFTSMITCYCTDRGIPSSPYLMPMSFAVILGNYAVFGSGSNLVISGLMEQAHIGAMPTFELAKSGLLTLPFVLTYLVFLPQYLISQNTGTVAKRAAKSSYILKCRVGPTSSLLGRPYESVAAAFPGGDESGVGVRRVLRGETKLEPAESGNVECGDVVAFTGPPTQLLLSAQLLGYTVLSANDADVQRAPFEAYAQPSESDSTTTTPSPVGGFFEVVLSGTFEGQGTSVASRRFQRHYRLSIASIRRGTDGEDLGMAAMPAHILNPADTLVCYGPRAFASDMHGRPDFLVITPIGAQEEDVHPLVYRFPKWFPLGSRVRHGDATHKALVMPVWFRYITLLLFVGIVIVSSLELTKLSALCIVVVVLYVLLGIADAHAAVNTVHYEVYVVVAFSFPLGSALQNSGLSTTIGAAVANAGITGFPLLLLISAISLVLANVITNIASAQVMLPLILSIYSRLPGENRLAAIVTSAEVIVCAICTPYSIPPNMLIYGPGGYTPKDYIKLGLPLSLMFALLVPFWSAVVYREL